MSAYIRRLNAFTRTANVMDLRTCANCQRIEAIRRKAARHEVLRHTAGTLSTFSVN